MVEVALAGDALVAAVFSFFLGTDFVGVDGAMARNCSSVLGAGESSKGLSKYDGGGKALAAAARSAGRGGSSSSSLIRNCDGDGRATANDPDGVLRRGSWVVVAVLAGVNGTWDGSPDSLVGEAIQSA